MVTVAHTDIAINSRFHLASVCLCPICDKKAVYVHLDSFYSTGKWYACEHIKACNFSEDGLIESVEFK